MGDVGPGHVSDDYFGVFADRIQQLLRADRQDPPFVGILCNGTSGDINNINPRTGWKSPAPYTQIRRVAEDVAQEVLRVTQGLEHHREVELRAALRESVVAARRPSAEEVEKARTVIGGRPVTALRGWNDNFAREQLLLAKWPAEVSMPLQETIKHAEASGPRIAVIKNMGEILDEMRITEGHLAALADVTEDIEKMYESYSKLYLELKEKAQLVAENREKALEEVKTRTEAWKTVLQSLLDRANLEYQKILVQTQAVGEVRLVNEHDIEAAGLEILVGFKGRKPVPLDAYTQSGGERTTATMSFLLALQIMFARLSAPSMNMTSSAAELTRSLEDRRATEVDRRLYATVK